MGARQESHWKTGMTESLPFSFRWRSGGGGWGWWPLPRKESTLGVSLPFFSNEEGLGGRGVEDPRLCYSLSPLVTFHCRGVTGSPILRNETIFVPS